MPYFHIVTNTTPGTPDDRLAAKAVSFIAQLVGKPAARCMARVETGQAIAFGEAETHGRPCANVYLLSLGIQEGDCANHAAKIAAFLETELGVPADRAYIVFTDHNRAMFGFNGSTLG